MFAKVLVANRGEIACRIIRTLKRLGCASVAVYSDADRHSAHVLEADEAVRVGEGPPAHSYLRQDALLAAAHSTGAEAIHPGYGFLSESADFADACDLAEVVFIGPTPLQLREFGLKHRARELAVRCGVALLPGSGLLDSPAEAQREALRLGFPLMLKSTAGGGGIGMQLVRQAADLPEAFAAVERLAAKNFSRGGVFLEKYVERARHLEVQIFGDGAGRVIALGERDCSTQRRNQKLIEETPAPGLSAATRLRVQEAAVRLGTAVGYRSAGTVEFVYDVTADEFYFLEVNTRLQVEHTVTEEVTGIDLVEWMVRLAAGQALELQAPPPRGASIQVRVYAEDPARQFRPSAGLITHARFAPGVRTDTWVSDGTEITPLYDPLLAKIIAVGATRDAALATLRQALRHTVVAGIETNLEYLRQLLDGEPFVSGEMTTRALDRFDYVPHSIEVLSGGTQTTVQAHPGRVGFWPVGVPPSGPMDCLSFRLANRALGNPTEAAGLEFTVSGATLKFNVETTICLTGAAMNADIDGCAIPFWRPVTVRREATLRIGGLTGAGCRAYLAVSGGLDVPDYLGSPATFTLGRFGGHGGRALRAGDILHLGQPGTRATPLSVAAKDIAPIANRWALDVLYGPQGAPEFFTDEDMQAFFAADWEVHYNSSRTGVRLIGPKPHWARRDGGEAGLHPSNLHDNAYAMGAVDFTGDMPVILGPDGPSLGGFVCPATVIKADLWKLGQLRANDRVRFRRVTPDAALAAELAQEALFETTVPVHPKPASAKRNGADDAIVATLPGGGDSPAVLYRRAGDKYLLIEYGPPMLDLELRLRVHALMTWLQQARVPGVIELTPGIRSLQIHYESRTLALADLLELLAGAERTLAGDHATTLPTRIVRLPLSWDDEATQLAIARYMQSVRADSPWCPSNIEFIRRVNGLDDVEDVKRIVFEASYLVLGLGDVYLGAPVTTPLDPRHRLVTTKYNPARTWTPENAVGIGGAYLCVYGMEGPGGYQFVGRTCQMWNTYRITKEFPAGTPWLLRFFDQIRFYPVSGRELLEFREEFLHGRVSLDIREEEFRLKDYRRFLGDNAADIVAHKLRQQTAFDAERRRWEAAGQTGVVVEASVRTEDCVAGVLPAGHLAVECPVSGSVWQIAAVTGRAVHAGDTLVTVESMKMELPVTAPVQGVVTAVRCAEGRAVQAGQILVVLRPDIQRGDGR